MKITAVESFLLGDGHFVQLHTDDGLSGLGQSACWAYPTAVDQVVRSFAEYLVGQDPDDIERHWHHLYRMGPFRGSVLGGALSAVDIALWDLKGKALGVPVWQLLGGRARDRVRLCDFVGGSDDAELHDNVQASVDRGFTAVKIFPLPRGYRDYRHADLVRYAAHFVEVVRAAGGGVDIIVEFGRTLTATHALPLIDAVAPCHPLFVEDPIQIDSIVEQARFASRARVPIAHGERLHTVWEFRELLAAGGPEVVRPDVGLAGGLSHTRKIAALAESFNSSVSPHNCIGPVQTAATIHLDIAIPNFLVQEYNVETDEGPAAAGFASACVREGGYITAPTGPGLGVELDRSRATGVQYLQRRLSDIPVSADGFAG